jgi:hypothetical protein
MHAPVASLHGIEGRTFIACGTRRDMEVVFPLQLWRPGRRGLEIFFCSFDDDWKGAQNNE